MHLGSGAITPECAVLGFSGAAAGLAWSWWASRKEASSGSPWLKAAALGSLVFAAQMINLPVMATSSAHFVGGVLLAELLGPALGATVMSLVLLLQAVLLGDGGLAALGVNIVNMALMPAGLLALSKRLTNNRSLAVGFASAASILLAVLLIAGEVALGRSSSELAHWPGFVAALATTHLPVLPLEAALTLGLVAVWIRLESTDTRRAWRLCAVMSAAALLLALLSVPISSDLPDGYESAAEREMPMLLDK